MLVIVAVLTVLVVLLVGVVEVRVERSLWWEWPQQAIWTELGIFDSCKGSAL